MRPHQLLLEGNIALTLILGQILIFDLQFRTVHPSDLQNFDPALYRNGLLRGKSLSAETVVPSFLPLADNRLLISGLFDFGLTCLE